MHSRISNRPHRPNGWTEKGSAGGLWYIIKCITSWLLICNSGFRSRLTLASPSLTPSSICTFLTPRMQKPLNVSHAGTNYYISNIESNISHITGPHATQNQFTGTAQFMDSIWILGHLRSCWEASKYKLHNLCKVVIKLWQTTLHYHIKREQRHCYIPISADTWRCEMVAAVLSVNFMLSLRTV